MYLVDLNSNSLFTLQFWRPGLETFHIEPGSILISKNEKIIPSKGTHKIIFIGEFIHKHIFCNGLFGDLNMMHVGLITGSTNEEKSMKLNVIESVRIGVKQNTIDSLEFVTKKQADAFYIFTPKSDQIRKWLIKLAEQTIDYEKKIPYGYLKGLRSIFQSHSDYSSKELYKEVAAVLTDSVQGRQLCDPSGKIRTGSCSGLIMLLLQASYALEKIPKKMLKAISYGSRESMIDFISNHLLGNTIPTNLQCDPNYILPSEFFDRLLFNSSDLPGFSSDKNLSSKSPNI